MLLKLNWVSNETLKSEKSQVKFFYFEILVDAQMQTLILLLSIGSRDLFYKCICVR